MQRNEIAVGREIYGRLHGLRGTSSDGQGELRRGKGQLTWHLDGLEAVRREIRSLRGLGLRLLGQHGRLNGYELGLDGAGGVGSGLRLLLRLLLRLEFLPLLGSAVGAAVLLHVVLAGEALLALRTDGVLLACVLLCVAGGVAGRGELVPALKLLSERAWKAVLALLCHGGIDVADVRLVDGVEDGLGARRVLDDGVGLTLPLEDADGDEHWSRGLPLLLRLRLHGHRLRELQRRSRSWSRHDGRVGVGARQCGRRRY